VVSHLKKQPSNWLHHAAKDMAKAIDADWKNWKRA
jgi:hypothetical protein